MNYLFTSESVSEGHPDKVADQISDAVVDEFLARDPDSRVACETLVTTGQVVLAGEIRSNACIDVMNTARRVISRIGYNKAEYKFDSESCGIFSAIHGQSADISRGVVHEEQKEQGAGDQGMMFGYATNETPTFMPLPLYLANLLLTELADIRREGRVMTYLRPDAKSQVTVEYNERNVAQRVHTIVVSTQHDEFITGTGALSQQEADIIMQDTIREDVRNILIPRVVARLPEKLQKLFDDDFVLFVNPTGKFVIGGPHGDTGLTGRKIIVDTYGGRGAHGGGAFSGKDPSKVDRSAAYAARHIAKNLVAAGVADEVLVQVAYAIGVAKPVSLCVNTCGSAKVGMTDAEIGCIVADLFDMTPFAIEKRFDLRSPIYEETAAYGHFGREPKWVKKKFTTPGGEPFSVVVRLFPWEELDYVGKVKEAFGLE